MAELLTERTSKQQGCGSRPKPPTAEGSPRKPALAPAGTRVVRRAHALDARPPAWFEALLERTVIVDDETGEVLGAEYEYRSPRGPSPRVALVSLPA